MSGMKKIFRVLAVATMLTGVASPRSSGNDQELQETLARQSKTFMDAWQKQDMRTLATTLAPDFLYLGGEGFKSRAEVLQDLPHCTLTGYSMDDVRLRQNSPASATILYKLHSQASCEGHPLPPEMLAADTYVRRNGKWLISWTMLTPVMTH